MGFNGIHEILRLKSDQIQWNLMGFMGVYDTQIFSNQMESDGIHGVMALKSFQIKWNLMGFTRL